MKPIYIDPTTEMRVDFTKSEDYIVIAEETQTGITTIENEVVITRTIEQATKLYEQLGAWLYEIQRNK